MRDVWLPKGAFKNLYATRKQVELILNDPRVRGVALTGSEEVGVIIAAQAGRALKKSTMELGGADAFMVLKDADLDKTVKWAVFGRHWNGGQVCVSSKRIIVDGIYDRFLELYSASVAGLRAGDPFDPETTLAPLSSQGSADEIKEKIREAVRSGATATDRPQGSQPRRLRAADHPDRRTEQNPARYWEFFGARLDAVSRQGRRRRGADRQRFSVRPRRIGLHLRSEARR
jgi:succinate-semialdehyde dehydrogenase/glutarate-semialdehyde dehydrogenase